MEEEIILSKEEKMLQDIDYGNITLTRELLDKLEEKYNMQQDKIKGRIALIKNGVEFGLEGAYYAEYYPCRFIEVIDEERGMIEFEEVSIHKIYRESVLKLFVKCS